MTHIQLPFTLLPIYSVMRTISRPRRCALPIRLGARLIGAFVRIYLPQVSARRYGGLAADVHPLRLGYF